MDENGTDNTKLELASIDHAEYDALADLFLGDGEFAPEPTYSDEESSTPQADIDSPDDPMGESHDQLPDHTTHTPVLQLARHEDDAELGALVPDQDIHHEHFSDHTEHEPFEVSGAGLHVLETLAATDAQASALLAELMGASAGIDDASDKLGDAPIGSDEIEFIAMPEPTVEVVVLGHLPVRATLWARQYACSRAKEMCETVALVRAASGSTSVDLITGGESVSVRSFTDLDDALGAVSKLADRVIMRVDEASEPELLERAEIEEITVLTGADEAAVVASYRLIKTLDATLGERYIEDEGPALRVAVMGAGSELAMDACTKLRNAAETFLERAIEVVIGSGRIDATGTTNLYRDSISHPASHILDALVTAAGESKALSRVEQVEHAPARRTDSVVEFPAEGVAMPEPKAVHEKVVADKPSQDDAPTMRDGLCVLIPGLSPIEARCPKAPGVELSLDSKGRLHLVVCDADSHDSMNQLLAAQAWARNNLGLLIRAESGMSVPSADRDVNTDAMMHLISIEPRSVREIYDTPVRIYSLARVKVGKVIAQVATPIN